MKNGKTLYILSLFVVIATSIFIYSIVRQDLGKNLGIDYWLLFGIPFGVLVISAILFSRAIFNKKKSRQYELKSVASGLILIWLFYIFLACFLNYWLILLMWGYPLFGTISLIFVIILSLTTKQVYEEFQSTKSEKLMDS